jgi:hypothetical protein
MSDTIFLLDITNWLVYNFYNAKETCTYMYCPSKCLILWPVTAAIDNFIGGYIINIVPNLSLNKTDMTNGHI